MRDRYGDFNEGDFKRDLDVLCQGCNSVIGCVDQAQAEAAILSSKVFYHREWLDRNRNSFVYKPAVVIGLDLYKKIRENEWDCYNGHNGQLCYQDLTDNGYDYVMDYNWLCNQYKWAEFENKYGDLMECINVSPNTAHTYYESAMNAIKSKNGNEVRNNLLLAACGGHPLAKAQLCLYYHKRGSENNNREYLERSKLYCDEAVPLLRTMLEQDTHVQSVERMLQEMEKRGFEEARHCLAEWRQSVEEESEND
jgi:hypothetical protein